LSKRDGGPTAAHGAPEQREEPMLELLEQQKSLTINQWKIFLACFFSLALDFFDFFLISFVLAFFVRDWNLTYGQSALILLSSGVASVPAGYFFGWLGDRRPRTTTA
jgi:putative MFS transporter